MKPGLTPRRLEWLLRARGTDMAAWPHADRVEALALLRRSEQAQIAYAEALAREDDAVEADGATFARMQLALRRRLAPLPVALRGLGAGILIACMVAGLYLATAEAIDTDSDPFNTAQTITFAALDQ